MGGTPQVRAVVLRFSISHVQSYPNKRASEPMSKSGGSPPITRISPYARPIAVGLLVCGVALLATYWGETRVYVHSALEFTINWLRIAGPWAFFLAMAILPAVGLPLLPFALAAGPAFGPSLGPLHVAFYATVAVAGNVALSYLLARQLIGPQIIRLLERLGYRLPELPAGTAWQAVLMIRLAPGLPFWVQSYLLGLLGVAWVPYFVVSTLVPSFYLTGVIIFGEAIWQGNTQTALIGAMIAGVAAAAVGFWRRARKAPTVADVALE